MPSISPTDRAAARPAAKPRRWRALLARAAFVFAVLLTLVVGLYIVERYRGRAAWNAYQAEARTRGVKLDFADFVPPKIPDAENFASIPIFEAVFQASGKQVEPPNPFKLPLGKPDPPKRSDPTKQAVIDLAEWQKYFVETKLIPVAGDNAAADMLKALDRYAAPLAQLHEAGARPRCSFPVHWEQTWSALLTHLQLLQDAAKLYALRMGAHLRLGESGAAYEDFRDGLRLTTATREEPALISGLVRIANTAVILNAVWGGLAEHLWAEPELRRIETDLAALDWLKDCQFAMSSERAAYNATFDAVINDPDQLAEAAREVGPGTDHSQAIVWILRIYPVGWHYQNVLRMNRFFDELLTRVDPAQHRWFADRPTPSSPKDLTSFPSRIHYLFFYVAAPMFEKVDNRWIQAATVTDQARLACALERFRLAHGSYPAALVALAPEFIPEVPMEIVNGEPYHYRVADDGSFVLYSVGTDLRDDGGVIDPKFSASKQRDWVWRYPAK